MLQENLSALLNVLPTISGLYAHNFALTHPVANVMVITVFNDNGGAAINNCGLGRNGGKQHSTSNSSKHRIADHFGVPFG